MESGIEVLKTYKIFIGGAFPRSESGRYYKILDQNGKLLANACRCTRKDVRDAVKAAETAFSGWRSRSAYNRGQILYRIAEMMQTRSAELVNELKRGGSTSKNASAEVQKSIDRMIYYAGWSDKYQQVFGTVNPVASSHFNFSTPDATGVVSLIAPEESPLLGLVSLVAPAIVSGNTVVALASEKFPLVSVTFAEIIATSDVPGGVVNIITGLEDEIIPHLTSHLEVNAIVCGRKISSELMKQIQENAALNIKRCVFRNAVKWNSTEAESPYFIMDTLEVKTTWHPIGL